DSAILGDRTRAILDSLAGILAKVPDLRLHLEGHSDLSGGARYNLRLSGRRAEAVRDHLLGAGVDADRVTATGRGMTAPVARGRDPRASAINRRVVLGYDPVHDVRMVPERNARDLQVRSARRRMPRRRPQDA